MRDPQVLIVGAGIAGLSLGRALLSCGFSVEIVERAAAWPMSGAALYLPGGALTSGRSPIDALGAFAARRRSRIQWVKRRTYRRDRIRRLPALLRNLSLRLAGSAIYEADYRPLFVEP